MKDPKINIVVPLFNEAEVFDQLISRLEKIIASSPVSIEVILVDDGSRDETAQLMRALSLKKPNFQSIFLSRNFGHQLALSAGLKYVNATEAVLIVDGDLQDPPELLKQFYDYFQQGYEVVYAVRKNRKEHLLKRMSYKFFYFLLRQVSYINIPFDAGDFSLISVRVVRELNAMPEESRFMRGMRSWVGFRQIGVAYERQARASGKSKYSLKKLFQLAFNGLYNFSEFPIRFITNMGTLVMGVSLIYFFYTLIKRIFWGDVPEGFTALLFTIILFGGMQLIAIGVIGEYILRIFFQVKGRPLFIVKERIFRSEVSDG